MNLPRAQVMMFDERLGHSHWVDYQSRARTFKGLVRQLRDGVRLGEYIGYRLIHVYWESLGIVDAPIESSLKCPYVPPKPDDECGW